LVEIGEHDGCERRPIDPSVDNNLGPAVGHGSKRSTFRLEDLMTDPICVDNPSTELTQQGANRALARADTTYHHKSNWVLQWTRFRHGPTVP
jgi:hypothetical protein